ncbi:hypothetical protein ACQR1Y_12420 [Bradyrhizobium sp. HKCCYLRH3099]|uniref:hypothetical protein n=1 Tax=Bradyrhizobium TaxID=374 RepID=UPI003EBB5943
MTEIEELQAEIDALTGRLSACESAMETIAEAIGAMLEVAGVVKRKDLAHSILQSVRNRRHAGDGSTAELDLIERAAQRLLRPTNATVTIHDNGARGTC